MKTPLTLLASFWLVALSQAVHAKIAVSPAYLEVSQVTNSKELTQADKVARLNEMVGREETRRIALYRLDGIDPAAATDAAITLFHAADTSALTKLQMGHFLLEGNRPQREGFPKAFVEEFARHLIQAVLNGGEAEFCQKLEGHPTTAIGEYAYLASDFDGYNGIDFAPFKEARVVPVLIRCLDAPDNVFPRIFRTYGATLECVRLNHLKSISGKLEEISRQTANETIRRMTNECLSAIR